MLDQFIRVENVEDIEKLVSLLHDNGYTSEVATLDNVLNVTIFYLARMNMKLDNLGQLKHLHKLTDTLKTIDKYIAILEPELDKKYSDQRESELREFVRRNQNR